MRYVYLSLRHGNEKLEMFDNLLTALSEAVDDMEFNNAYPIKITDIRENITIERAVIIKEWASKYGD